MADPQRLLSQNSDADELERELLGSLHHLQLPKDAKHESWARLSAQIAAIGVVSATHTSTAAASPSVAGASASGAPGVAPLALKLAGSKLVIAVALAGGALGASALWVEFPRAPAPAVRSVAAPPLSAPVPESLPSGVASTAPAAPLRSPVIERVAKATAEPSPVDRLSAESALLTQARAQLRSRDTTGAQQTLSRLRANFPKGVLGQEREVLEIEVLAAQGNVEGARRRARAFILAHPTSPHSPQLSRYAERP